MPAEQSVAQQHILHVVRRVMHTVPCLCLRALAIHICFIYKVKSTATQAMVAPL